MKEAMFWEAQGRRVVKCSLCSHRCRIAEGARGLCGVRENQDGKLYSLVYGRATAMAVDPIEKKPLYHFLPGTSSFSIATRGCNFRCIHCQNCDISQPSAEEDFTEDQLLEPEQAVRMARARGCASISYTYTEPTIFFEYAYDTARVARKRGLKNVFVTNGYITPEALQIIQPCLDAANIDLKSFRDKTYRKLCGARLQPVLEAIDLYYRLGIWIEITTLVIPGWNDSEDELRDIAAFIAGLGREIPWHVSRFLPAYRMSGTRPTPVETLLTAYGIGKSAGLQYVYLGNVSHPSSAATMCPSCGRSVIDRNGLGAPVNALVKPVCPKCGYSIAGVWE